MRDEGVTIWFITNGRDETYYSTDNEEEALFAEHLGYTAVRKVLGDEVEDGQDASTQQNGEQGKVS